MIEQIDDSTAVNGIAREPVGMPGDDSVRFTLFDSTEHLVEEWAARRFSTVGFLIGADDDNVSSAAEGALKLRFLRFDRENLAVLALR